jgi:hypothetical protein
MSRRAISVAGRAAPILGGAVAALCLLLAPAAAAHQIVKIDAGLSPERLGEHTAVTLGFQVRSSEGGLPSPLTHIDFHYPPQLGFGNSELGMASCSPENLQLNGPKSCPANSIMGRGNALAQFQVSPEITQEGAAIALVAGPSRGGYVNMLISASGASPIDARVVMSALLLPGHLQISVPLVPGVPEGPDVAVVRVKVTIGGDLTYYERRHGRRVAYRPPGVLLPRRCPRSGFRFSASFSFLDGSSAQAQTVLGCPRR